MKLLLARHGNTFDKGTTPVFVGSQQDLPLVEEGLRQAERYADFVRAEKLSLKAIYCGPLKRTRQFAEIVSSRLGLSSAPIVDSRLDEIDYGGWGGLTNEEVTEKYGEQSLKDWNDQAIFPDNSGFYPPESELVQQTEEMVRTLCHPEKDECLLFVSSNGRLRYFLKLLPEAFARAQSEKSLKVLPGNACLLELLEASKRVIYWNRSPQTVLPRKA